MADLDLQTLGMRLGEAITPTPSNAPQVSYGTVDAVNADGTLDVELYGATLRGLVATTGCVGAQAGMRCIVLRQGALATVVGLVAGTDLADVFAGDATLTGALDVSGTASHHDNVVLDNNKALRAYDGNGVSRSLLVLDASGNLQINWGMWDAASGTTYLNGNAVAIRSKAGTTINGFDADSTAWAYLVGSSSGNHVRYCKRSGVVFVEVWYESGAAVGTSAKTLATLPAGFRPSLQVETAAFGNANNLAMLRVNPGGSIVAKVMSGTTNYLKGIISFPV